LDIDCIFKLIRKDVVMICGGSTARLKEFH